MDLNLSKISSILNDFAIDRIYEIIEKYGFQLNNEQLELFNALITSNRVIRVDYDSEQVRNHYANEQIPAASGPRSWGDGLIHIYPFIFENKTTEEIIEKYITEGIITHELFHYLVSLDTLNNNPEYDMYYSFLNEGFVQYLTEQIEGREIESSNYRSNVEFVKGILNKMNNNTKGILNKQLSENEINLINEMYKEYINEQESRNNLNIF